MADESLLEKIHELSDLELAVLLCLVSREHCLISTPPHAIDNLILELEQIASRTFGLRWTVVECNASTTLQDFASALLSAPNQIPGTAQTLEANTHSDGYFSANVKSLPLAGTPASTGSSGIANFVIAKNLDRAPQAVQIQALELLRTRRIFTRTSVQVAPKQFVFVPVLEAESGGAAHVTAHLNDHIAIAHWHDPGYGFVNLEELDDSQRDAASSTESVIKNTTPTEARISEDDITSLRLQAQNVEVDIDVIRYQMNIVSFLRMHRAVAQGITPSATKYFQQLMRNLAPLHKLEYVTPALVCLAARKVYLHRIHIVTPEKERSVQWGSTMEAVASLLENVGPEEVIEEVLEMVSAPV